MRSCRGAAQATPATCHLPLSYAFVWAFFRGACDSFKWASPSESERVAKRATSASWQRPLSSQVCARCHINACGTSTHISLSLPPSLCFPLSPSHFCSTSLPLSPTLTRFSAIYGFHIWFYETCNKAGSIPSYSLPPPALTQYVCRQVCGITSLNPFALAPLTHTLPLWHTVQKYKINLIKLVTDVELATPPACQPVQRCILSAAHN